MTKRPKLGAVFSGEATAKVVANSVPTARAANAEEVSVEKIVQLNVAVPESLRRLVKIKALQSGQDMNTVVKELLTAWVKE
ncbi:hypothetical protein K7W42_12820 [Deinococcus sp. HMF7604]|uniref:hypothetical protein n=1 Tax=Deinococcus betulae TaxID=2873312 RepID=UPI001CCD8713|nr:hypothetical protein [Deinococcus betulae]MBZ9751742.1 hypothetical protein [Deinococcus betulae]